MRHFLPKSAVTNALRSAPPAAATSLGDNTANVAAYILPAVYLIAMTAFGARVFQFLPIDMIRVTLATQLGILIWYAGVAIFRQHLVTVTAAFAIVAYFVIEHLWFSQLSRTAPNFNSLASYLPILSFLVFVETRLTIRQLLRLMLAVAGSYCLIYLAAHDWLLTANQRSGAGILADDGTRGTRLFLLASWASYLAFYGVSRAGGWVPARLALIALGVSAIWVSGTRTFGAMFALFAVLAIFRATGRATRTAIFATVTALTLLFLAGLLIDGWNPYEIISDDASAAYRGVGYRRVIAAIANHWAFGIGLPQDTETLSQYLKIPRAQLLYSSDFGTVGMMMMLGLPALVGGLGVAYFCTIGSARQFAAPEVKALQINAMLAAAIGWLSPMLLIEPTAIFLGLLIALWVRLGDAEKTAPVVPIPASPDGHSRYRTRLER